MLVPRLPAAKFANVIALGTAEPPAAPRKPLIAVKSEARVQHDAEARLKRKIEQANRVLDALAARESQLSARIGQLSQRKDAALARAQRLEDRILAEMSAAGLAKATGLRTTFAARPCPLALEVKDAKLIPAQYFHTPKPPKPEPDKNAIKAVLARAECPSSTPEELAAAAAIGGVRLTQKVALVRSS